MFINECLIGLFNGCFIDMLEGSKDVASILQGRFKNT